MNKFFFNTYLSFWQRVPIRIQNRIVDFFRYRFNVNTLKPPLPQVAVVDPINICNLDCPLCASKNQNYEKGKMSIDTFKKVLNDIPSLKVIVLFNWGEPLLHKEITKIIKLAVQKNIYTITHTNFSFRFEDSIFEELVKSGLQQLIISADGASQETYEKYRVKGRFDWVIKNIKTITRIKKELKARDPKIIWKFLVNRYNEHELDSARKMAEDLGIEIIFDKMGLADDIPDITFNWSLEERKEKWLPKNEKYVLDYYKNGYKLPLNDNPCNQLFTSTVINPDGKVTPCCWVTSKENVWGDITKDSFKNIWNNDNYRYARSLFNRLDYEGNVKSNVCTKCEIFKRIR